MSQFYGMHNLHKFQRTIVHLCIGECCSRNAHTVQSFVCWQIFEPYFWLILFPFVGDPGECTGYIAIPPSFGIPENAGLT